MTIPAGWAEFNDANAVIRGRIVAATGTFSGTFTADNVEAVKEMNIKGGAVSAYYGFSFASGSQDISFSIPAQPHASVVDLIVPFQVHYYGLTTSTGCGYVNLYRNGSLIGQEKIYYSAGGRAGGKEPYYAQDNFAMTQVVRYPDMDVSASQSTTYRILLQNGSFTGNDPVTGLPASGWVNLSIIGSVVAGVRKR